MKSDPTANDVLDDDSSPDLPVQKTIFAPLAPYLAYILLVCCIGFWQAMGVVLQDFTPTYPQHYFTTWCVHNGFISSLLVWISLHIFYYKTPIDYIKERLTDTRTLKITAAFSLLSLTGTCVWYYSLEHTVLSANNAIYQTVPVFVFVLSIYFLGEKVTKSKIVALVLCMIGIVFITLYTHSQKEKDGQIHSSTPGGYLLCLLSVLCYAVYEVFYAVVEKDSPIPDAERNDVMESFLFVGLMGVFNLILLLPGMPIVKALGFEKPFEWPPGDVGGSIAIVALLETGFHMFLLAGIAVKGPVFMAVGQILIIPTGYVYDAFQGGTHTFGNYMGVFFILSGFTVMQELPWTKQLIDKIAFRVCGMKSSDDRTLSGRDYSVLSDKQQEEELSSVM